MVSLIRRACSSKYTGQFNDGTGIFRRIVLFSDKGASKEALRKIVRLTSLQAAGEIMPQELRRFIEGLPDRIKTKLAAWGIVKSGQLAAGKPLAEYLESYKQELVAKGNVPEYIRNSIAMISKASKACGWRHVTDITASSLQSYLSNCRNKQKLSVCRVNAILIACKAFANMLTRERQLQENPLAYLSRQNADVDRRLIRRALDPAELPRFMSAADNGEPFKSITGKEWGLIFRLASQVGLRWKEIMKLTAGDFRLDDSPRIIIPAATSKNRSEAVLPLRQDLAGLLREALRNKLPTAKAVRLPYRDCGAEAVRFYLQAAGLAYKDQAGRIFDFHSFRGQFATDLARAGVPLATARELMRHSDVNLTAKTYSHFSLMDKSGAVEKLPDLTCKPLERIRQAAGGEIASAADDEGSDCHNLCHKQGGFKGVSADLGGQKSGVEAKGK